MITLIKIIFNVLEGRNVHDSDLIIMYCIQVQSDHTVPIAELIDYHSQQEQNWK